MSIVATSNGDVAHIALTYADHPPIYRLSAAGAFSVAIELENTISDSTVGRDYGRSGPVGSMYYEQVGSNGRLRIVLLRPVPVRARATEHGIVIDVGTEAPVPGMVGSPSPGAGTVRSSTFEVIPLKYADISEIVGALVAGQTIASNDVFSPQLSQLGQPLPSGGFNSGLPTQPVQQIATPINGTVVGAALGQRINENIAVDRRLNAVIVSGPDDVVAPIKALIARLDVPLRTVLLETQIVELTDSAAKAVGIDYASNTQLGTVSLQARSFQQPTITANLQAAIYDVVSRGGGRLLAKPSIVAQDGAAASILTGDAIPIITNVTSFGATTVTQQQVQYVQVGVNLQIQPHASGDGYVTSHIYSQVSSVTGYVQGFPQISQRTATTSATVRDGESFVIGGLIQENELHNLDRIPGISSLPIIGGLFRNRRESRTSTNLYIVITPKVLANTSR